MSRPLRQGAGGALVAPVLGTYGGCSAAAGLAAAEPWYGGIKGSGVAQAALPVRDWSSGRAALGRAAAPWELLLYAGEGEARNRERWSFQLRSKDRDLNGQRRVG